MQRFRIEWSATKLVSPSLDPGLLGKPSSSAPAFTNTGGWLTVDAPTSEEAVRQFRLVEPRAKILSIAEAPG